MCCLLIKMAKSVIFLVFLVSSVFATPVNICKSGLPQPSDVQIENCDKQPCPLVKGKNHTMFLTFKAPESLNTVNTQVIATSLGVTIEYKLPEPDACKSLTNATCPLKEGQVVTYKLVMPVDKAYPQVPLSLEFSLQNDKKKSFNCFKVSCKVVNP